MQSFIPSRGSLISPPFSSRAQFLKALSFYITARELFGLHRVGIQRRDGGNRGWHTFVADKARQVSRGGGSLPVIGGEMRVEFEPLCRELKLNARPPSNHLTSSIHLRFFHGNLFPMEGDALRGRNNRLLLPRISSLSSLFFLFSPSFFRFGSKSESESRETRRNIFFFSFNPRLIRTTIFIYCY